MKKSYLNILFLVLLLNVFVPLDVFAHPGRLNSSGCHTCKTNCASWGLSDYEYHCHNGNTYTNSKGQVFNSDGTKISDGNSPTNTPTVPSTPSTPTTPPSTEDDITNNEPSPPSTNNNTNNNSNGGTSSSGSTSTTKPSSGSSSSNITSDNKDVEEEKDEIEEEEEKSNDTSIKSIKVNGKSIDVVDNMYVETIKRSLTL